MRAMLPLQRVQMWKRCTIWWALISETVEHSNVCLDFLTDIIHTYLLSTYWHVACLHSSYDCQPACTCVVLDVESLITFKFDPQCSHKRLNLYRRLCVCWKKSCTLIRSGHHVHVYFRSLLDTITWQSHQTQLSDNVTIRDSQICTYRKHMLIIKGLAFPMHEVHAFLLFVAVSIITLM